MRVKKHLSGAIAVLAIIMIISGIPQAMANSSAAMEGNVLHVWSHDYNSGYVEVHTVDRTIRRNSVYAIKQDVMALSYSGDAGVVLLEVEVINKKGETLWLSFYWFGGNSVDIYDGKGGTTYYLDMSVPHNYEIEVTMTSVRFYIDGEKVHEADFRNVKERIKKVTEVHTGRWVRGSTYDLYVDNVQEYWSGRCLGCEDFEDGTDDFYTSDVLLGSGDSGEEVVSCEEVPVFPFLKDIVDALVSRLHS